MKPSENMTSIQMLQTVSGICKTNAKMDRWTNVTIDPVDEFNYIANMIDTYIETQDRGSEGVNQDG